MADSTVTVDKHLTFLKNAAQLMSETVPAISRSISFYANNLAFEAGFEVSSPASCLTCGTLTVPGKTAKMESNRVLCLYCNRTTRTPRRKKRTRAAMLANQRPPVATTSTGASTKNAKTKERQKARVRGLAATLKAKEVKKGFDLHDFML